VKIIFFAASDIFLQHFCLVLARFLRSQDVEVVMMSSAGDHGALLEAEGFRWISLPMNRRSLNPLHEIRLLRHIRNIYKEERPCAVHNFTVKSVIHGGLAAQAAGIANRINTVPGLGYVFSSQAVLACVLRPILKLLLRFSLRGDSSRLILQHPDDRQLFLANRLIKPERIQLIKGGAGSGVDTAHFSATAKKDRKKFRVLMASRLLWEKGVGIYAKVAELLAHRSEKVEFLLAGAPDAGNPGSLTNTEVKEIEQAGYVTVLGHITDMRELMSDVDLFVLPSHYREGVPQVLMEAASMSLPLIATDAPGCREIVADGINGFLIPVKNATALAEKIEHLLDHPELCVRFGKAGRKKVLDEFDQQIVLRQTAEVYRSLGLL
jgi:glycosyltransferase involved in cell wall biosynthesis